MFQLNLDLISAFKTRRPNRLLNSSYPGFEFPCNMRLEGFELLNVLVTQVKLAQRKLNYIIKSLLLRNSILKLSFHKARLALTVRSVGRHSLNDAIQAHFHLFDTLLAGTIVYHKSYSHHLRWLVVIFIEVNLYSRGAILSEDSWCLVILQ